MKTTNTYSHLVDHRVGWFALGVVSREIDVDAWCRLSFVPQSLQSVPGLVARRQAGVAPIVGAQTSADRPAR